MDTTTRTYFELKRLGSFEERFEYLRLHDDVGRSTFGFDRYLNQKFYKSYEWKQIRDYVIVRDNGCDLGINGYEIHQGALIHHINPMVAVDITHNESWILDPEYLITTTQRTHNAIHYGDVSLLPKVVISRKPGDTALWRHETNNHR
jgi:hypothetical protein